ncbi:MAG: ABC-F family ATP-binding cassette domain-containing protein [bacterium]|nr:ABC-F family ATP-binding cassette domain-containing protein [bacterium]
MDAAPVLCDPDGVKSLLQISKLKKSYGARTLFEDATASFGERQKIGVVGRNGAGKSTLFRIILGQEEADSGEVIRSRDLRLGYVEQHAPFEPGESVLDFLQRYTEREGWECGKVAGRFGLKGALLESAVDQLAGGFQMRVKLTAMLLGEPNLLLLDEPTNYLDLNTLLLLERFLEDFNGAYLVISHDREFLKRTCQHTLEVENGDVFLYPGALEEYFDFKAEQEELKLQLNRNTEARRKELQSFVERFRAKASKAAQAKSKAKQLEKLQTIEIGKQLRGVQINLPEAGGRSKVALRVENLAIGYRGESARNNGGGSKDSENTVTVATNIDFTIERGARVAVLGANGQGKSTLLKTLTDRLEPLGGTVRWTDGLQLGFYAQHVYEAGVLDPAIDIYTALERAASPNTSRQTILNMAGSFLFSGDDVEKRIGSLSGGERARVCLAGILLGGCQVLLLDEPTNHLDFDTVEALGQALQDWDGTVLFVSHDRTFVKLAATQILEASDGAVRFYPGAYDEYVYSLAQRLDDESDVAAATGSAGPARTNGGDGAGDSNQQKPNLHLQRKAWQADLKRLRKELTGLEKEMQALERERDLLTTAFAAGEDYSREKSDRLNEITAEIEAGESRWLELEGAADELESQIQAAAAG